MQEGFLPTGHDINADSVCIKIQLCKDLIAHHDCLGRVVMIAEPQGLFVQSGAVLRG